MTTTASTAIWPADWSQMIPDIIVALIMGVVVGAIILWFERRIDKRRLVRENTTRQLTAVETARRAGMWGEYRFDATSLAPREKSKIKALAKAFDGIANEPTYETGFLFMFAQGMADTGSDLLTSADNLTTELDRVKSPLLKLFPRGDMIREINRLADVVDIASTFGGSPYGFPSFGPVVGPEVEKEGDLQNALRDYFRARIWAETLRRAFHESDGLWRVREWEISLYLTKDAPVPLFLKWRRSWAARERRRRALAEAEQTASAIVVETGTWIPQIRR